MSFSSRGLRGTSDEGGTGAEGLRRVDQGASRGWCRLLDLPDWSACILGSVGGLDQVNPFSGATFFLSTLLANPFDHEAVIEDLKKLSGGDLIPQIVEFGDANWLKLLTFDAVKVFDRFRTGVNRVEGKIGRAHV